MSPLQINLFVELPKGPSYYVSTFLGFLDPHPSYVSIFLVTCVSKKWHFVTTISLISKCKRNVWMVPSINKDEIKNDLILANIM